MRETQIRHRVLGVVLENEEKQKRGSDGIQTFKRRQGYCSRSAETAHCCCLLHSSSLRLVFFFFAQTRGVVSYLFDISECEVTLCLCALLCGMTSAVKAGSQLPWLQELMQSMSSNNWCARLPQREAMCQFPGRPSARPVLLLMLKSLFNPGNHFKMSKKREHSLSG